MGTGAIKHSGNAGDVIGSLPAMREYYRKTGKKVILYLNLNVRAQYYQGATHPTRDSDGEMVMLNRYMFGLLRPIIEQQDYIEAVRIWQGEKIDVDFDKMRETHVNMPWGSLNRWIFYVFPDLACDLTKTWIDLPHTERDYGTKDKIVVNITERYRNPLISYYFLKDYDCVFTGTVGEHEKFCKDYNLNIPRLEAESFLDVAHAIHQSKLFLGNQSCCFQIAEAIKHPRVLELCRFAANVIPFGENAYDFYSQTALEYYVKTLWGKQ